MLRLLRLRFELENTLVDDFLAVLIGGQKQRRVAIYPHADGQSITGHDRLGKAAVHAYEARRIATAQAMQ